MKKILTPIERSARNSIVWKLHKAGFNVSTIANIMSMGASSVSRTIDKMPTKARDIDVVLFGESLE